jgi:geranylgeranyl diphosphate synthase type I
MITLLACEAVGGQVEDALDFAVGIELVHSASLVVDDVIDDSDTRRGTDSAWAAFGYGPALIASDGLLGEAFSLLLADERATEIVAGAMVELGEGEAIELAAVPESGEEYLGLARRKTGALFRAAAQLGAVAAGAEDGTIEAVGEYAEAVGVAFQIRDDVLDATADADALGKPAGRDAAMDRPSIVQVTDLSPEEANERAREHAEDALAALSSVEIANDRAEEYLRDLAEFVVVREK